jgi:hypothetical protein
MAQITLTNLPPQLALGEDASERGALSQRAYESLTHAFAQGRLDASNLETRLQALVHAKTAFEIAALTVDLGRDPSATTSEQGLAVHVPQALASIDVARRQELRCVFANQDYRGGWLAASYGRLFTTFAMSRFDFRDLNLAPGVTEFELHAWFASVEIIVPPGLRVEIAMHTKLADLEEDPQKEPPMTGPERIVRISGQIILSRVVIRRQSSAV